MSAIARFLFILGIIVIIVGVATNLYTFIRLISISDSVQTLRGMNLGASALVFLSSFTQGATLIALGKIIQLLEQKI